MSITQVTQELNNLNEAELKEIVEYMAFLKFRSRMKSLPAYNESQLAALYAKFADEDRQLAEEGMVDYYDFEIVPRRSKCDDKLKKRNCMR